MKIVLLLITILLNLFIVEKNDSIESKKELNNIFSTKNYDFIPHKKEEPYYINYIIRPEKHKEFLREIFIDAIIYKETKHNNLINHKENAVGYLQIRPIMIRDINRIVGYKKFNLKDRWNKKKSIQMFVIYQDYYNPEWDFEIGAKIWNGGPTGYLKNETNKYWEDINDYINIPIS